MTRERIEDMREVVLPFVKKRLLETNYENLGESDAEEFAREFNEILDLAIKALEQEPITKNDLGVREFEEIVVEYPPEDLCSYPEYKGKPYFSIKYKEGNDCSVGYGTYNPKVLSRYLRDYFMPLVTPQEPRWIPDSERLPESNENYLVTYCYQNEKETIEAVYKVDEDEAKWFDVTGVEITLAVTAWMPKPKPYREVEE